MEIQYLQIQYRFLDGYYITCHLLILKYIKIILDKLIINGKLAKSRTFDFEQDLTANTDNNSIHSIDITSLHATEIINVIPNIKKGSVNGAFIGNMRVLEISTSSINVQTIVNIGQHYYLQVTVVYR